MTERPTALNDQACRQRSLFVDELLRLDRSFPSLSVAREAVATALYFVQRSRLLIQEEAA